MDLEQERPLEPATDEVEAATPEVDAEPKQMEDTIRDEYRRLTGKEQATDDAAEQPAAGETRSRGPDGKFVAKPAEAAATAASPESPNVAQAAAPTDQQQSAPDYPKTWRKELQGEWGKLPPAVKAEIQRREENFFEGIKQYQEPAAFGRAIGQEMLPHVDVMRQVGVTPQQLTRDIMSSWSTLVKGNPDQKRQVLLNLAQQYGIDMAAPAAPSSTGSAPAQAVSPDLSPVLQRVQGIEQMVRQQAEQQARVVSEQAMTEVQRFASNPERKHFPAVQDTMSQLIGSGQASTLDDAYDKAIWLVPEVRNQLLAEQDQKRRAEEASKAAAARKAADVNVARRGTTPVAANKGTMDDTIREAYRGLMNQ